MSSCPTCGHDHEAGEICGVCDCCPTPTPSAVDASYSLPQQILSPYLFLGSYHDAYRCGSRNFAGPFVITHYLSILPGFHIIGDRPGTRFYILGDDINPDFDEAFEFIDKCRSVGGTVLVHCISGNDRSAAVVTAYLMRLKLWPLKEALGWVMQRRPQIDIDPELMQRLKVYEQKIFPNGTTNGNVHHD